MIFWQTEPCEVNSLLNTAFCFRCTVTGGSRIYSVSVLYNVVQFTLCFRVQEDSMPISIEILE